MSTDAGRVFLEEARKVLAAFDFAVAEARRTARKPRALRGLVPEPARSSGCCAFFVFSRSSSTPVFHISHLVAAEQVKRLKSGELDLGILHHAEEYEELELVPLFEGEPLAALLPRVTRWRNGTRLARKTSPESPLVVFPRSGNSALPDQVLTHIERPATASETSTRPEGRTRATC